MYYCVEGHFAASWSVCSFASKIYPFEPFLPYFWISKSLPILLPFKKKPLNRASCWLVCSSPLVLLLFLKLQVFSPSFALTGEDHPPSSLLSTMWDWREEAVMGSLVTELFYTHAMTHPLGSEFTTCLYSLPANKLQNYFRLNSKGKKRSSLSFSLCWYISSVNGKCWMWSILIPVLP